MTEESLRLLVIRELEAYHKIGVQWWREPEGPWKYADRIMEAVRAHGTVLPD